MSTVGQFSSKNTTIKRILKEASELASQPSPDYHAAPLENDLLEWHFTLRGPPAPSHFEEGVYHGRIVLPPTYPYKPPSFRFLTPTGRFEVNREICLSISGHHEETWQPAWGIRTALVAIRSFMDTDAKGQLGGMDGSEELRRRCAVHSKGWKCGVCGKSNEVIMKEQDAAVAEKGGEDRKEEVVPEELRLAYREELGQANGKVEEKSANGQPPERTGKTNPTPAPSESLSTQVATTTSMSQTQQQEPAPRPQTIQQQQRIRQDEGIPPWIDKVIYGLLAVLLYLLWRKIA